MAALLTPFAATSNGFIFPHIRCSSAMHDLQQISDESICSDCFSVHGTFKAFISHHVIDAQVSADKSFELNQFCSDHKDMVLDFYCSDHHIVNAF
jgi:hypothetical protein